GSTEATKPYAHRAKTVCPLPSEKYPSHGEPGIQLPTTTAASVKAAPISDASTVFPGRRRYMYQPTNRAMGMVQAMVKTPHEEPGTSCTLLGGMTSTLSAAGVRGVSAGTCTEKPSGRVCGGSAEVYWIVQPPGNL